ncbi:hypothetical protein [Sulfuracidifex tepidarius]|uniref:PD-(D/E)XK endonuclease-like domain-containing protein n=1 Tax=Sulfuracidifex tepidarius TaxID=1294262 RepID=A0A510DZB5_9CREN|nr:hypothetical protein [Sulfuracidifex tepidarius]BBG22805.1 hypothetical protein IC006_0089 [Sulfuracidifex tepidarius]BBG25582.1 hypothetical protein IC007_0087 [Sulfuracidifex tepidarius]
MLESSLKKRIGDYIKYSEVYYEIMRADHESELRLPSNDKLGQIFHSFVQYTLTGRKVSLSSWVKPLEGKMVKAVEILKEELRDQPVDECDKLTEIIHGVKVTGQADLCSSEYVVEIKSKEDMKKEDLMQALIYTFLYKKDVILFMFNIYTADYCLIKVFHNDENASLLIDAIRRMESDRNCGRL